MILPENLKTKRIRKRNIRSDPQFRQRVEPTKKRKIYDQQKKEAAQEIREEAVKR